MNARRRVVVALGSVLLIGAVALVSWLQRAAQRPAGSTDELSVRVTSADDLGPGSLREALYIAASAQRRATIWILPRKLILKTPLPPVVNPHGMSLIAQPAGAEIDARSLTAGAVFDVTGPNTSIEGVVVRNCPGAAVLLRATHFHMHASTVESCDVGVDVAVNAADVLLDDNRFANDRIGVRFAAANADASVVRSTFTQDAAAGLWAVRGESGSEQDPVRVHDNHFSNNRSGIVAGNIRIAIEHNDFAANGPDAALHLVGADAVVRSNQISGTAAMGIVAENAREPLIEANELKGLSSYAILVRSSPGAMVRGNRVTDCAAGLAFVLGDPGHPGSAVANVIADAKLDAIDVIGDSPILRDNQVLRPHALALRVTDYVQADGQSVHAKPTLQGSNNFGANIIGTVQEPVPVTAAVGKP
ncbi:MAG TPA: right-handed parallel beta-helix repeat-containing protein [Steroidobacteraceae bacterium]|nr:right-handed parallel beta-helix repeat-containing protein [Steroidobacteraceae bacterium]